MVTGVTKIKDIWHPHKSFCSIIIQPNGNLFLKLTLYKPLVEEVNVPCVKLTPTAWFGNANVYKLQLVYSQFEEEIKLLSLSTVSTTTTTINKQSKINWIV